MTRNEALNSFYCKEAGQDGIELVNEIYDSIKITIPIYKFYAIQLKIGDVVYSADFDKKLNVVNIVNDDIGMYIYLDNNKTFYFENNKYLEDVFILLREI